MGDEDVSAKDCPSRSRLHDLCSLPGFDDQELAEVRELLKAGADPNLVDRFERSPLSLLCMHTGDVEAAKALLAAGALPSSQDAWGRTSLHWCCDRGWLATAELLLGSGALVNACTKQRDTPMLWAAKSGHAKMVELLLKSGCDPLLRNNRDETALDVAADEVVRTLLSSGVPDKIPSSGVPAFAPPLQKAEEAALPENSVHETEQAQVASKSSIPTTASSALGSRALAGLPMGGHVGTSGGLFSAYKKQPMSSTSGSGSGPGPKKMKITLKKK